jgi:hypothetical protein
LAAFVRKNPFLEFAKLSLCKNGMKDKEVEKYPKWSEMYGSLIKSPVFLALKKC